MRKFLRRAAGLVLVASVLVVGSAAAAGASTGVIAAVTVSLSAVSLYIAPFVPIVTAAFTKLNAPGWLKVGFTAVVSTVTTLIATAIQLGTDLVLTWDTLGAVAMAFGVAMGSYLFLRVPVTQPIAEQTKGTGIGPSGE